MGGLGEGLGGVSLLKDICHWRRTLRFQMTIAISSLLALLGAFSVCLWKCEFSAAAVAAAAVMSDCFYARLLHGIVIDSRASEYISLEKIVPSINCLGHGVLSQL